MPKKLKEIGRESFFKCGFTGELVLPDGLTSIGLYAFLDCSKLTGRLSIPDEITSIESGAFSNTGFDGFDTTKQEIADMLYDSGIGEDKITVGNQPYHHTQLPPVSFFQDGNMTYQIIGSDTVALTDYNGNSDTDISIPDKVTDQVSGTTYSVTRIGPMAVSYTHLWKLCLYAAALQRKQQRRRRRSGNDSSQGLQLHTWRPSIGKQ